MRRVGLLAGMFLFWVSVKAQQPVAAFSLPGTSCLNKDVALENLSTNATDYNWDFCPGDLSLIPTASLVTTMGGTTPEDIEIVFDGSNWFGFVANRDGNSIIRLDFGSDIKSTPTTFDLGNVGSVFRNPTGIKVVNEAGLWYGFVYSRNGNLISRLDFGISLSTLPTAQVIVTGGGGGDSDLDMAYADGKWHIFFTAIGSATVVRLNSITATPSAGDMLTHSVNGVTSLAGCKLIRQDNNWFGYAVSNNGSNTLQRISFGADIFNATPNITNISASFLAGYIPYGVEVGFDNNAYYAFISTLSGDMLRINLGTDLSQAPATSLLLGNLGILTNTLKPKLIHYQSSWMAFNYNYSSTALYRIEFPNSPCDASVSFSDDVEPVISYATNGQRVITLSAYNNGMADETHQLLLIDNRPIIDFTTLNNCVNHDVFFAAENPTNDIIAVYDWNFGDTNSSIEESPEHQYVTAGTYDVTLSVTTDDGCKNVVSKSISIYNQPVADFTVPSATPLCTNQSHMFNNTTADVGITPSWSWTVNAVPVSSSQNLNYAFTSTANQAVKLTASIPGCTSEKTVNINTLVAGPNPDFTTAGQCEDTNVNFTNTSTGAVTGYSWNFGDSQMSTITNPVNIFADPGIYDVVLTASNAAGCSNTASKQVTIYSVPEVNFTALAPPFSCSGTPTQFSDQTPPPADSNLSTWLWNFGDTGNPSNTSSQKNPQHTYTTAGDYPVSLTVTSNFLCSAMLQKSVTIQQTPDVAFTHSALCEDGVVIFSDEATTNQAWSWEIGSGFYSTETAEHVFNNPGSYTVILSVTAANNCIGTSEQTVVVAPKLLMDFSVLRNCINQQTEFTDLTNDTSDPITGIAWNFGGFGNAQTNPATFTFLETGTVDVTLTLTTESGCEYPLTKSVSVASGPLAAFTAEPNSGEAPLTIQFSNTSLNAATFSWKFGEGSTSSVSSPSFIYLFEGEYLAELIAVDANNCSDSTRQLIEITEPAELNPPTPNPSTGVFAVEWRTDQAVKTTFLLVDATGRVIRTFNVMADEGINRSLLDITGEQSGLYILQIRYSNSVKTYRLILSQ